MAKTVIYMHHSLKNIFRVINSYIECITPSKKTFLPQQKSVHHDSCSHFRFLVKTSPEQIVLTVKKPQENQYSTSSRKKPREGHTSYCFSVSIDVYHSIFVHKKFT